MSFFCIKILLRLLLLHFFLLYLSVCFSYRCWRQILDEFRFRFSVHAGSQCVSSITLTHTVSVSFHLFFFLLLALAAREELLT